MEVSGQTADNGGKALAISAWFYSRTANEVFSKLAYTAGKASGHSKEENNIAPDCLKHYTKGSKINETVFR